MGNNVSQQIDKHKTRRAQSLTPPPQKPQRFSTLIASVGLSKRPPPPSSVPATPPLTKVIMPEPEPQQEPEQEPERESGPPAVPSQTEKEGLPDSVPEVTWLDLSCSLQLIQLLPSSPIYLSLAQSTTIRTLTLKQQLCLLNQPPFLVRYVLHTSYLLGSTVIARGRGCYLSAAAAFIFSFSDLTFCSIVQDARLEVVHMLS